jgi:hypothetical protein
VDAIQSSQTDQDQHDQVATGALFPRQAERTFPGRPHPGQTKRPGPGQTRTSCSGHLVQELQHTTIIITAGPTVKEMPPNSRESWERLSWCLGKSGPGLPAWEIIVLADSHWFVLFNFITQSLVHLPQIQKTQRINGCSGATHEVRILQKLTLEL